MELYRSSILTLAFTLAINSCVSDGVIPKLTKQQRVQSGWTTISNSDYYVVNKNSEASERSIQKESGSMMQESCIQSIATDGKVSIINNILSDASIEEPSGKKHKEVESMLSNISVRECKPTGLKNEKSPFIEWKSCECDVYAKIKGTKESLLKKLSEDL